MIDKVYDELAINIQDRHKEHENAQNMAAEYFAGRYSFRCSLEFGWWDEGYEPQLHSVSGFGETQELARVDAGRNLERYEHRRDDSEISEFMYIVFPKLEDEYCLGVDDE